MRLIKCSPQLLCIYKTIPALALVGCPLHHPLSMLIYARAVVHQPARCSLPVTAMSFILPSCLDMSIHDKYHCWNIITVDTKAISPMHLLVACPAATNFDQLGLCELERVRERLPTGTHDVHLIHGAFLAAVNYDQLGPCEPMGAAAMWIGLQSGRASITSRYTVYAISIVYNAGAPGSTSPGRSASDVACKHDAIYMYV